jgi:GAF domain-containing protein
MIARENVTVCFPLSLADQVMGVMNLSADETVSLDRRTMELLLVIGRQIAITLNQAKQLQEMTKKTEAGQRLNASSR